MSACVKNEWLALPRSRAAAKASGYYQYFTGKQCLRGHIYPRGTSYGCIECDRLRSEAKRQKPDYRDKYNEWARMNYAKDPLPHREKSRCKRLENPEDSKARDRRSYERTKPARMARRKIWRHANPDKVIAQANKRRAAKLKSGGHYTADDVARLIRMQKYKCAECNKSVRLQRTRHVDHIMPLSKGGSNDASNIQILCSTCNLMKGAMHPLDWAAKKGRLL